MRGIVIAHVHTVGGLRNALTAFKDDVPIAIIERIASTSSHKNIEMTFVVGDGKSIVHLRGVGK